MYLGRIFDERPTLVPMQRITPNLNVGETVFPSDMYTAKSYSSSYASTFERNMQNTTESTVSSDKQNQFPQNNCVCENESCTQRHGQQQTNPAMQLSASEQTDQASAANSTATTLQIPSASTASKELFYCDFCNKRFTQKYILENPQAHTHRRETLPVQCVPQAVCTA